MKKEKATVVVEIPDNVPELKDETIEAQVLALAKWKAKLDKAEVKKGKLKETIEGLELAICTAMGENGLSMVRAGGYTLSAAEKIQATVKVDDRDQQLEWLRATGRGDLIQEQVNASTFAGLVRNELLPNNEKIPAWVNIFRKPALSMRKTYVYKKGVKKGGKK